VAKLKPFIEKNVTRWQFPIPVECRVAIALWRVGSSIDYRSLGEHFGLGKATVFKVIYVTLHACDVVG